MVMTLPNEKGVGNMASLPTEVVSAIEKKIKQRPSNDVPAIVSEVVETFAGMDPDKLLAWFKSAGGPSEFVQLLFEETRRIKSESKPR